MHDDNLKIKPGIELMQQKGNWQHQITYALTTPTMVFVGTEKNEKKKYDFVLSKVLLDIREEKSREQGSETTQIMKNQMKRMIGILAKLLATCLYFCYSCCYVSNKLWGIEVRFGCNFVFSIIKSERK